MMSLKGAGKSDFDFIVSWFIGKFFKKKKWHGRLIKGISIGAV